MANQTFRSGRHSSFWAMYWPLFRWLPLLGLIAWSCKRDPSVSFLGDWKISAPFEGAARTAATGFTIGRQAFVGIGKSQYGLLNDFWAYDQTHNAWVEKARFPGPARWGGVGFAIGEKGYIGLGMDAHGNRLNDFYEYSLTTNQWRRIADFGGTPRVSAIGFTLGDKGYVGLGDDLHDARDLWAYNPDTDNWQKMATYTGPVRVGAVAIVIGTLAYIGTGSNQGENLKDWWAYDPVNDLWLKKHDFTIDQMASIEGRDGVGFAINGKGYVCLSNNKDITVWAYDPVTDLWGTCGVFEGRYRTNSFGFSLGTKGYVTTGGIPSGLFYNDLFEFDPSIPQYIP